jgi:hypothetical protein
MAETLQPRPTSKEPLAEWLREKLDPIFPFVEDDVELGRAEGRPPGAVRGRVS